MKKNFVVLLVCILGIMLIICGCTSTNSQSSTINSPASITKMTSQENLINQDFSSMALTINDLPRGWITQGEPTKNTTMYQTTFIYIGGSSAVPLTFTIRKYPSINDAKTTYNQWNPQNTNSLAIGEEGFGGQDTSSSQVTFRHRNLIVTLSAVSFPPLKISDLLPYAKLVDSRIKD